MGRGATWTRPYKRRGGEIGGSGASGRPRPTKIGRRRAGVVAQASFSCPYGAIHLLAPYRWRGSSPAGGHMGPPLQRTRGRNRGERRVREAAPYRWRGSFPTGGHMGPPLQKQRDKWRGGRRAPQKEERGRAYGKKEKEHEKARRGMRRASVQVRKNYRRVGTCQISLA